MLKKIVLLTFTLCFVLLNFSGCKEKNILMTEENADKTINERQDELKEYITIDGKTFSIVEINARIKNTFNTVLYYNGEHEESQRITSNKKLILNKQLDYELYFEPALASYDIPIIHLVFPTLIHPSSKPDDTKIWCLGAEITKYGTGSEFYSSYRISQNKYRTWFGQERYVYLGTHSMCIEEIVEPVYEEKSDEWKRKVEKAIQLYMDENNFYSEKSKNLKSGKYHVYVKNFTEADEDSRIIFEHEDGAIYEGFYYFVHEVTGNTPANLNHVELFSEEGKEFMKSYLDKVKESAAICVEYEVKNK